MKAVIALIVILSAGAFASYGQTAPSTPSKPFVVRTKQQISDVVKQIRAENGNQQFDIVPQAGDQMRVAVFHDDKRENDFHEVHDASDDIYYVLEGEATLKLGGVLVAPHQISPGEWRSKTAAGGQLVNIKKGDLVVVPRGTAHQRTVAGKGFSMILIKVFANRQ